MEAELGLWCGRQVWAMVSLAGAERLPARPVQSATGSTSIVWPGQGCPCRGTTQSMPRKRAATPTRPQVMADLRFDVHKCLEINDQKKLKSMKATWKRKAAEAWCNLSKQSVRKKENNPQTPKRKKAYEFLLASDQMLFANTGKRWEDWCFPDAADRPDWASIPTITVSVDQGGDGWVGLHYLANACSCGVVTVKDPNHRLWDDAWGRSVRRA